MSTANLQAIRLRPASAADLPAINRVIERAVLTWKLPERVIRLALPSYRYHPQDLGHMRLLVAETALGDMLGVAALDAAEPGDLPPHKSGLLLHGLYVDPECHGIGVGSQLLHAACLESAARGLDGLLVKAQPDAVRFFQSRGMTRLPVKNPDLDYPHRLWMATAGCTASDASTQARAHP